MKQGKSSTAVYYVYPHKNSQAVKKGAALKSLGEKSCEKQKGGGQQMATMMLMLINFNNAQPLLNFIRLRYGSFTGLLNHLTCSLSHLHMFT